MWFIEPASDKGITLSNIMKFFARFITCLTQMHTQAIRCVVNIPAFVNCNPDFFTGTLSLRPREARKPSSSNPLSAMSDLTRSGNRLEQFEKLLPHINSPSLNNPLCSNNSWSPMFPVKSSVTNATAKCYNPNQAFKVVWLFYVKLGLQGRDDGTSQRNSKQSIIWKV